MTEHPTFEVPPGEGILHGLTEDDLTGLRHDPPPPVVVLFIDNTDSRCGACGKTALPTDIAHTTPCGYDNHEGCGAPFTHLSSNYGDTRRAAQAMRPDLPWLDYAEAHKHDGARKPRTSAPAEQPPALSLPDGWERNENTHGELYCVYADEQFPDIYADVDGVEIAWEMAKTAPANARTYAARLVEAAGIVEQLQRGAR